jgi:hypothetical protein
VESARFIGKEVITKNSMLLSDNDFHCYAKDRTKNNFATSPSPLAGEGGVRGLKKSEVIFGSILRAYPRTGGDCPDFVSAAEQNGTVPFAQTVLG